MLLKLPSPSVQRVCANLQPPSYQSNPFTRFHLVNRSSLELRAEHLSRLPHISPPVPQSMMGLISLSHFWGALQTFNLMFQDARPWGSLGVCTLSGNSRTID